MVTSGFADWNPACQAPWAASWALEPAPFRVPLSFEPDAEDAVDAEPAFPLLSLPAAQALRPRPRATAATVGTTAVRKGVRFTSCLLMSFLVRQIVRSTRK